MNTFFPFGFGLKCRDLEDIFTVTNLFSSHGNGPSTTSVTIASHIFTTHSQTQQADPFKTAFPWKHNSNRKWNSGSV